jgi:hypothetical protein
MSSCLILQSYYLNGEKFACSGVKIRFIIIVNFSLILTTSFGALVLCKYELLDNRHCLIQ